MNEGDEAAVEFESRVDATLQMTCELARTLVGAHQAAMSLIVAGDWAHARKYFSLSDKYARWRAHDAGARHRPGGARSNDARRARKDAEAPHW